MTHHAPFSIQDIQSAVEQGREAERARIIVLLNQYAEAACPDICGSICECFAKHEARMFIDLIRAED
jgi:hypothetical protein